MEHKELRPPCEVVRPAPLNYEQDKDVLSYLVLKDSWNGVQLCEFRNVYVSPYGVLFRNGSVENVSVDYSMAGFGNRSSFAKKVLLGRVRRIAGTCVVCHNAFFKNYYHWLLEAMPRLFCIRDEVKDAKLILCSDVDDFHLQSLKLFDLRDIVFVKRDELILAERLLMPGPACEKYGQHNPELLAEMAAWTRGRVELVDEQGSSVPLRSSASSSCAGAGSMAPGAGDRCGTSVPLVASGCKQDACTTRGVQKCRRRLYVGRGADKRRKIVNEPELVSLLGAYGFDSVRLEDFSFAEQVAMFSQVGVLAGIHGAGLANMLFMNKGGLVLEFVNERYKDGCFFNLASACNHGTLVLPCRMAGTTNDSGPKYYDMEVDLDKLSRYLESVEGRGASFA